MAAPNVSKVIPVDCDASAVAAVAACDDDGTTTRPVRSGEIDTTQFDQAKARVEQKAASLKVSEVTRKLEQAKRAGRMSRVVCPRGRSGEGGGRRERDRETGG